MKGIGFLGAPLRIPAQTTNLPLMKKYTLPETNSEFAPENMQTPPKLGTIILIVDLTSRVYIGCGPLPVTVANEGFSSGFPIKDVIILVVTGILGGGHTQSIHENHKNLFHS